MHIDIYHVDAFSKKLFGGNPAAVCLLEAWLPDDILQHIAMENNLSETAFLVPRDEHYHLRWFTPKNEVDLCGHATLASGYVILNEIASKRDIAIFYSASGELTVTKAENDSLNLDMPIQEFSASEIPNELVEALGIEPLEVYQNYNYLVILESEKQVREINPNLDLLSKLDVQGVIVTAKGDHVDFVSRYFAPRIGVNEDPVTGSAHCALASYWSERYGKTKLHAKQLSNRQGEIFCEVKGKRVILQGHAVLYSKGKIFLK